MLDSLLSDAVREAHAAPAINKVVRRPNNHNNRNNNDRMMSLWQGRRNLRA